MVTETELLESTNTRAVFFLTSDGLQKDKLTKVYDPNSKQ
jgi:hypothetical protein